jgi:23S rRNA (adenine2030-N6)-methyltransferase
MDDSTCQFLSLPRFSTDEGRSLNYRHRFHAGNFCDVIKHVLVVRLLSYLQHKGTPFRVIDTHAGAGKTLLAAPEPMRTGEWHNGIGRLAGVDLGAAAEALLAPYRAALAACDPTGAVYPGSPWFIRHFLRAQDRASLNELHPETAVELRRALVGRDDRLAFTQIDGFMALKAQIPPPERRGLILIDPPFEEPGEFDRMAASLAILRQKWPTGMACLWYPIKDRAQVARFERDVHQTGLSKILVIELHVDEIVADAPLAACGLIVINPPWVLADEMRILLGPLAQVLARGDQGKWRVETIGA